nr:LytTR family DNA-binding domain-containing protein [Secundilactobacillus yichangensis]
MVNTNETLSHFLGRAANPNFVQVSKHAALNLDHLLSLADSFSGSMSARLTNGTKTEVSRKYVKELMRRLEV